MSLYEIGIDVFWGLLANFDFCIIVGYLPLIQILEIGAPIGEG